MFRTVRAASGWVVAAACLVGVAASGCNARPPEGAPRATDTGQRRAQDDVVARGKYLVSITGCNDCHTPWQMGPQGPAPDMNNFLAGHPADFALPPPPKTEGPWLWHGAATNSAFAGPWGVSYAINLTPDEETGIGLWSEQVFVNALKTGRHMGVGRPILPPMPVDAYRHMTDEDLRAMFAYLRTIEPRRNQVPDPVVAEPPGGQGEPTAPTGH
jgi:mono/diheme cytochrome c family protein